MSDLVERLRKGPYIYGEEAADRIEELEAALLNISEYPHGESTDPLGILNLKSMALAALGKESDR